MGITDVFFSPAIVWLILRKSETILGGTDTSVRGSAVVGEEKEQCVFVLPRFLKHLEELTAPPSSMPWT